MTPREEAALRAAEARGEQRGRERLQALSAKWRATAAEPLGEESLAAYVFDEMLKSCANELDAALAALSASGQEGAAPSLHTCGSDDDTCWGCERDKRLEGAAPSPRAALGFDTPWPITDVLRRLADAADHLLNDHCCDTHGWEGIGVARDRAREIATAIQPLAASGQEGAAPEPTKAEQEWATASQFVRDIIEAIGFEQPDPKAVISLEELRLQVVGLIEDLKAQCAAQERE